MRTSTDSDRKPATGRREIVVKAQIAAWEDDHDGGTPSAYCFDVQCGCGAGIVQVCDDIDTLECQECESDWREVCANAAADCGESLMGGQASAEWRPEASRG